MLLIDFNGKIMTLFLCLNGHFPDGPRLARPWVSQYQNEWRHSGTG